MDLDATRQLERSGLQRKLFFVLGPLVALLLVTAVAAILLLQGVLADMAVVNRGVARTGYAISMIAARTTALHANDKPSEIWTPGSIQRLHTEAQGFEPILTEIDALRPSHDAPSPRRAAIDPLIENLGAIIDGHDPAADRLAATLHAARVLAAADEVAHAMLTLAAARHDALIERQDALVSRFRWIVVGLTLAFILVVNVSVVVVL